MHALSDGMQTIPDRGGMTHHRGLLWSRPGLALSGVVKGFVSSETGTRKNLDTGRAIGSPYVGDRPALYEITQVKAGLHHHERPADQVLSRTTFARENIQERAHLQAALRDHIELIDENSTYLGGVRRLRGCPRRIDLLCIDKDCRLVVVELKRTADGGHMELQASAVRGHGLHDDLHPAGADLRQVPTRRDCRTAPRRRPEPT